MISSTVFLVQYSLKILPIRPPGCSSFLCISLGHAHFEMTRYRLSESLRDLFLCFSVVEHHESPLGKPESKSVESRHTHFSPPRGNPPSSQSLQMQKCIRRLYAIGGLSYPVESTAGVKSPSRQFIQSQITQ